MPFKSKAQRRKIAQLLVEAIFAWLSLTIGETSIHPREDRALA
jgi:hypothetical protein